MNLFKLLLIVLLLFFFSNCNHTAKNSNRVEVEQILATPTNFAKQTIIVRGVVNQVNSEKQLFSVISQKEFKECGIAECNASEQLPVRYGGALPRVGEQIEITGMVKKIQQGFVYEAQSIRYLEDI